MVHTILQQTNDKVLTSPSSSARWHERLCITRGRKRYLRPLRAPLGGANDFALEQRKQILRPRRVLLGGAHHGKIALPAGGDVLT